MAGTFWKKDQIQIILKPLVLDSALRLILPSYRFITYGISFCLLIRKCRKHSADMMGTLAITVLHHSFHEMTIKHSLTKSMINKDTRTFSQYLMVQSFHWMNSQNSFYVLENLFLWEYPISHSIFKKATFNSFSKSIRND